MEQSVQAVGGNFGTAHERIEVLYKFLTLETDMLNTVIRSR